MKQGRRNIMHISYSDLEYEKLRAFFERSSCQSLSEYGRKVLLHEPVIFRYRNETMEDLLEELVDVRMELKVAVIGFERALQQYLSGRRDPSAERILESVIDEELRPSIAHIMKFIEKFWDEWLRNSVGPKA